MTKIGKRTQLALDTLEAGGYFWGSKGLDFHGRPFVKIELRTAENRIVKGVSVATLTELVTEGRIVHDGKDYLPMLIRYRGFVFGAYRHVYGPVKPA